MSVRDGGYSLDQLLKWCEEDKLIDGYDKTDDAVVIFVNGGSKRLNHSDATTLLRGIFTATQRSPGSASGNIKA